VTTISPDQPGIELAAIVIARLVDADSTVATAESITGGLLAATITAVPGASACYRGGIIAYATEVKRRLLDIPDDVLRVHGAVSAETAVAMAGGARTRLASTFGTATTGVAGPDASEGKPLGLVHVAVVGPRGNSTRMHHFAGNRSVIQKNAVDAVLNLLLSELEPRI
jgi:nicotinamide-nucleotide amidase